METTIYNISGEDTGKKITLSDSIFSIEPNDHAIYLDVKRYLNNQRQGTHKSKERAEITGSNKKLKRQKGTGTARAGSIKSPIFRGGGRTFGPRPRVYKIKLNKKLKTLAKKSALTYQAKDNNIRVMEDFTFEEPKTKKLASIINGLKLEKKSLFVLSEENNNIYLSSRNLPGVKVIRCSDLNTYDILNHNNIIFLESSVDILENNFNNKKD
jgi:large subunit ribosomal protein L4